MSPRFLLEATIVFSCVLIATISAGAPCPDGPCVSSPRVGVNVPFSSVGAAELSARCLTLCGEEVEGIDQNLVTSFGVWTSVDETLLQSQNCRLFYEYKECQLGCSLQPSAESSAGNCRDTCFARCGESCSFTQSCGGPCTADPDCRGTWCRTGCETAVQLDAPSDDVPATPQGFTVQSKADEPGIFEITDVDKAQLAVEDGLSAFLWRVETAQDILYLLQSSLTETLDLSYFSCQQVAISLAVVNRNGTSPFTAPSTICVLGGIPDPPSAPQNFERTATVDDPRPGFFGHAVVTLEWDRPQDRPEALTGYELTVIARPLSNLFPANSCGDPNMATYLIPANATSYDLRAESIGQIPQFGPQRGVGGCSYVVTLQSLPETADNDVTINVENGFPAVTTPTQPVVTQTCNRILDPLTGLVAISLNYSYGYNPLIEETIVAYTVNAHELLEDGRNGAILGEFIYNPNITLTSTMTVSSECTNLRVTSQFNVIKMGDRVSGELVVSNLCPREETDDFSLHYSVSLTAGLSETMIWWRPLPVFRMCQQIGTSEMPSIVNADSIVILDNPPLSLVNIGQSQYNISLGVAWDPPLFQYGTLEYEVYLGGVPVEENSMIPFSPTVADATNTTLQRIIIVDDDQRVYLQIRSRNEFFTSSWSRPFNIIEMEEIPPGSEPSSLSGAVIGAIVGVIVVVVLAIAVTILVVLLCVNHRRKSKLLHSLELEGEENFLRYRGIEQTRSNREILHNLLPLDDEWEIPPVALEVEKQLGEGCFGQVYKGFVRGPIPGSRTMKDSIATTVAIKYLKAKANSAERRDFVNEIEMMKKVAQGANPHVVSLIGCVTREEPLCLIIEYLKYGDLRDYLHSIKEELAMRRYVKKLKGTEPPSYRSLYADDGYVGYNPGREGERDGDEDGVREGDAQPYLTPLAADQPQPYLKPVAAVSMSEESPYAMLGDVEPVNLVSFAYQIAAGMEYLSSLEIIHRDLACRNVLVGEGKALKIADFGLSRVVSEGDAYVKTTSGRLPIKWMAIESINDRVFTVQSDVWAFGVVVWEIATLGGFPYPSIPNEELRDYLLQNHRLEKPPNCTDAIYELMLQCWEANPEKRPTFTELRATFENILLDEASYIQFSSLTELTPEQKSEASKNEPQHKPVTGKTSNPYVIGPHKQQSHETPLTTPTEETAEGNSSAIIKNGDALTSATDEKSSYTLMVS